MSQLKIPAKPAGERSDDTSESDESVAGEETKKKSDVYKYKYQLTKLKKENIERELKEMTESLEKVKNANNEIISELRLELESERNEHNKVKETLNSLRNGDEKKMNGELKTVLSKCSQLELQLKKASEREIMHDQIIARISAACEKDIDSITMRTSKSLFEFESKYLALQKELDEFKDGVESTMRIKELVEIIDAVNIIKKFSETDILTRAGYMDYQRLREEANKFLEERKQKTQSNEKKAEENNKEDDSDEDEEESYEDEDDTEEDEDETEGDAQSEESRLERGMRRLGSKTAKRDLSISSTKAESGWPSMKLSKKSDVPIACTTTQQNSNNVPGSSRQPAHMNPSFEEECKVFVQHPTIPSFKIPARVGMVPFGMQPFPQPMQHPPQFVHPMPNPPFFPNPFIGQMPPQYQPLPPWVNVPPNQQMNYHGSPIANNEFVDVQNEPNQPPGFRGNQPMVYHPPNM